MAQDNISFFSRKSNTPVHVAWKAQIAKANGEHKKNVCEIM